MGKVCCLFHTCMPTNLQILFVHGMGRSPLSAWPMLWQLRQNGHTTKTFGYCTSLESFSDIKNRLVAKLNALADKGEYVVIGHSLGGVLLRAAIDSLPTDTRKPCHLFLLASPIKPARLATRLRNNFIYRAITRDCGQLLGSDARMQAIPPTSVPTTAIVGVCELPFSTVFSPEEVNDGIVSLSEVSENWINDQVKVNIPHSFIPASRRVGDIILDRINQMQKV